MKLIANSLNGHYLRDFLPGQNVEVDGVYAAIAYGSNSNDEQNDLIGNCISNKRRLDIWMRYDHTVPVAVPLLNRLLQAHKDNVFCKLVPDYLHAKVIWWKGYGAYVGSANLTDRAWLTNLEVGTFFNESDLSEHGIGVEIEFFFEELRKLEQARPLTQEIVDEMTKLSKERADVDKTGAQLRKQIPIWGGPAHQARRPAEERRQENFLAEWNSTLTVLRDIGGRMNNNRPVWLTGDVPEAWQADQFLHAYYYKRVGEGNKYPYEEYHQKNKGNPSAAIKKALEWWSATATSPTNMEKRTIYEWAPTLMAHLSKEKILSITTEEFAEVCHFTHATQDHISKMSLATMGLHEISSLPLKDRTPIYAKWLLKQHNKLGWNVLRLIEFVLYGGEDSGLPHRLYLAARDSKHRLPHYGLNSMAELSGWVRPKVVPPRNGRTSKSLRALGYDVSVY